MSRTDQYLNSAVQVFDRLTRKEKRVLIVLHTIATGLLLAVIVCITLLFSIEHLKTSGLLIADVGTMHLSSVMNG